MRDQPPQPFEPEVHAAGCVVWRPAANDGIEVLLVHRPRYDDWSLPKGKRDPGETDEKCARRELREETGLHGDLGAELSTIRYTDHRGRAKQVRYWAVELAGGLFEANDEVDEIAWLAPEAAADRLTYDHDRALVREALDEARPGA